MRQRTELTTFTRADLERIAKWHAEASIIGSFFIGKFESQTCRWMADGSVEVVTKCIEGNWSDHKREQAEKLEARLGGASVTEVS